MSDLFTNEPMMDMYLFETSQFMEQLEHLILSSEKESTFSQGTINEIFRIMHTVKGSSAIMMFHNISTLAHTMEDVFYFIREQKPEQINYTLLSDYVLEGIDFIKIELEKIKAQDSPDGDATILIHEINSFLEDLKSENGISENVIIAASPQKRPQQYYISQDKSKLQTYQNIFKAIVFFDDGCEMENIRAYTILHHLQDYTEEYFSIPQDVINEQDCLEFIKEKGFIIYFKTNHTYHQMNEFFQQTIFLKSLELIQLSDDEEYEQERNFNINPSNDFIILNPIKTPSIDIGVHNNIASKESDMTVHSQSATSMISVSVAKLDKLMDLVGEMVIAEAMVTQNPDLRDLVLDNFQKASQHLNKITGELQDIIMSIRMVPLTSTFQKMHRIVRDMSKQLSKEVNLEIIGEDTEVDKNIIEHISDPLMHLVRNAIDHGIECGEDRVKQGKEKIGTVTLEAKNSGSDVLVIVRDDGKGLDQEKILKKASEQGLLYKRPEDMTEREIFHLILLAGFSTNDTVSEFSGRGVGMDVVTKNIEQIGGTVSVDSIIGKGTMITLTIPLTLAIIDGMNIKVGNACYTIPTTSIKESLKPSEKDIITDPDGNEMLLIRGQCIPIIRLHKRYQVDTKITDFIDGIIIVVEQDHHMVCLFADELLGQQQVVVKVLPTYLQKNYKIKGIAGCTLLGDGSISLILDVLGLMQR